MPTFGRETIRKFHTNALAMKRLAARDFEDLLHVSVGSYLLNTVFNDRIVVRASHLRGITAG